MPRLPTIGGDNNDWGNVLNEYLSVSLDTDGAVKKASVEASLTGDISTHTHNNSNNTMTSTSFSASILLDSLFGRNYGTVTVSTNNEITLDSTNIKDGGNAQIGLMGDGTHTPALTAFNKYDTNGLNFDTTNNMLNVFVFFRQLSKVYWVILDQYVSASSPSTLSAPSVTATVLSTTSLRFSWTNITNNSGYRYKISTNNGSTYGTPVDLGTNIVTFDITGLSVGTRRDVQVLALGNGTTYLDSAYSTNAYQTTASLTQLSTPTLNAPSVISSTQINLSWSTVSNVTSWKLETSPNGTSGWTQIGGTIASGTLLYNHTSLTPATAYYYRLTAVGDQVTYSDSSASTNVNATTKTAAPTLVSSATSTDGLTITHTFSRAMASSPTTTGYSTSPSKTISSATINVDTTKIDVAITPVFTSSDTITATIPSWLPADGGDAYAGVSGVGVTNNTVAVINYIVWTNVPAQLQYDGNGAIEKISNDVTWDSGAASVQSFSGNVRIEAKLGTDYSSDSMMFGFNTDQTIAAYNDMSHAIFSYGGGGTWRIMESGVQKVSSWNTVTPIANRKFSIERNGNTITYQVYDGATWYTVYTSLVNSSGTIYCGVVFNNIFSIIDTQIK